MTLVRLYLDDLRNPPDDGGGQWTICRTAEEARAILESREVDEASLDHDLGQCSGCIDYNVPHCPHVWTGYDLVKWMAETGRWPRLKPRVHSANPVGRAAMVQVIERWWPGSTTADDLP